MWGSTSEASNVLAIGALDGGEAHDSAVIFTSASVVQDPFGQLRERSSIGDELDVALGTFSALDEDAKSSEGVDNVFVSLSWG